MNKFLIESIVQLVNSLPLEERKIVEEKILENKDRRENWRENLKRIEEDRAKFYASRDGKPLEPPVDEIIHQMREERTQQLMEACFPKSEEK
jgi:hypothetical protein